LKKRFQKFIKNERGFGNPIESLIPIVIIGIIAAIAIPAFMNALEKRPTAKDVNCIKTMIAIAQGAESTEATCPVSELEYELIIEDTQVSVSCPDPEAHLLSSPRVVDTDQGLIFEQMLPGLDYAKSANRDIADRTVLADLEGAVVVSEKMGWGGYLIVGLIILALLSSVIRNVMALIVGKNPGKGLGIVFTWAIVCLIGGFFFQRSFIKPEYRFSKSDGTVSIHKRYAGEKFSDPEIFNDIVGVVPLRKGKERMSVTIFYETTEGIHHRKLFRMDNEKLEIVSLLNHALFQGDPPIFEPPEPSAEQIETAEKTKRSREEKPGFFKMLKAFIAGKGNKPHQRFHNFIPKPKVKKRQFKGHQWVNPDDDAYRKHQIQQENIIKGQMEALRMQQQQQEQMWRQAEALRMQQQQQEQMWRQQLQYDQLRNQQNYHQMR
jgi:type II secretory pathway pseudopilin PulG